MNDYSYIGNISTFEYTFIPISRKRDEMDVRG